ncbi:hypothetical protein [Vibrio ishigakensis]|uniref:hypothetical protein n=1 Tax=Vibrio ishigakensis TaxID=1481914 RepID=UPI0021C27A51|nr:hypothetical protein [Vibrio ishigakensis]
MSEQQLYDRYLPGYTDAHSEDERQRLWFLASPQARYKIHRGLQQRHCEGDDCIRFRDQERAELGPVAWPDLLSLDVALWKSRQWNPDFFGLESSETPITKQSVSANNKPDSYINSYSGERMQLFYESRFVYARIYSAAHYVLMHAKLLAEQWSQERFRHHLPIELYTPSTNERSFTTSLVNINGYQSLRKHFLQDFSDWSESQQFNWLIKLNDELNKQTAAAYIIEYEDDDGIPWIDFVCKNDSALNLIRPAHFVEDIQRIAADSTFIEHQALKLASRIEDECKGKCM